MVGNTDISIEYPETSGLPVIHPQRRVQWNLTQCIGDLSLCENGFGRIPANTQTIERERAAAFKPRPDHHQD
jgi:hypothetical protein